MVIKLIKDAFPPRTQGNGVPMHQIMDNKISVEQFPIIMNHISNISKENRRERAYAYFNNSINDINISFEIGGIIKAKLTAIKDNINYVLGEIAGQNIRWEKFSNDPAMKEIDTYDLTIASIKSTLKKINKDKYKNSPYCNHMQSICNEAIQFVGILDELKELIISNKEFKEKTAPVYVPPHVSTQSKQIISEIMNTVVDTSYNELIQKFETEANNTIESFSVFMEKLLNAGEMPYLRDFLHTDIYSKSRYEWFTTNSDLFNVISKVFDFEKDYRSRIIDLKKKNDISEIVHKYAKDIADTIRDMFVNKNVQKIAYIVDKKDNLENIEIIGHNVSMAGLEGSFKFVFKDGSKFSVRNRVVLSYSKFGKPFYRFPLNFFNVEKVGGELMIQPSEKKMNEEF